MPYKSKEEAAAAKREYYRRNKEFVWRVKRFSECSRCGFDHPAALDFHHRDSSEKRFTISAQAGSYSIESIKQEIRKCDVLCANCHRIEHHTEGAGERSPTRLEP